MFVTIPSLTCFLSRYSVTATGEDTNRVTLKPGGARAKSLGAESCLAKSDPKSEIVYSEAFGKF